MKEQQSTKFADDPHCMLARYAGHMMRFANGNVWGLIMDTRLPFWLNAKYPFLILLRRIGPCEFKGKFGFLLMITSTPFFVYQKYSIVYIFALFY